MDNDTKKLLVVDDSPEFLAGLTLLLTEKGYRVITASGGREAIDESRESVPVQRFLDTRADSLMETFHPVE